MRGSSFLEAVVALAMLSCAGNPPPAAAQEPVAAPVSYAGKTVFVTGSTDGLGRSVALAEQGAHVIVHGRDATGAQEVLSRRRDLSLDQIRRLAREWHIPADALIGKMAAA